jgi:hypothetical protein
MMRTRLIVWALPVGLPLLFLPGVMAQQVPDPQVVATFTDSVVAAAAVEAYWTPERMAAAEPMATPGRLIENSPQAGSEVVSYEDAVLINGWVPGSAPYVEQRTTFPRNRSLPQVLTAPQTFGTAPTDPLNGPYGPFQRWTMEGRYLTFPRSVHGKFFFTLNALNYVCSATVIGRSTIATAGHCVSDGTNTAATNMLFCPSYLQTGVNPSRGCWAAGVIWLPNAWHNGSDPDYDYACAVTNVTGTVIANKIGNVTGWAGRAAGFNDVPVITAGYPQAAPFGGKIIQLTASTEWYNWDFTAGNQVSKIIGSDLTGGSSGGGWFLGWAAPGAEVADTDGSNSTDPGTAGPFINGVNSHKRCKVNCSSPPTVAAGVYWQEMTSPPFRGNTGAAESEHIFSLCLANANNNASEPARK